MFKRVIYLMIILTMFTPWVNAANFMSKFSISLKPGALWALTGSYNDTEKLRDMVLPGAGLGLSLRYEIFKKFFIEACYSYNWMFIREEKKPSAYDENTPAFILPMYTLNGTLFLASGSIIPYITLGGGLCPWRFSSEAWRGEIWLAPENADEDFSKTSLSLNAGLGIEVYLWPKISILCDAGYYYIFSKDETRFGTEAFTAQDFLGIRLGITFYFARKQPLTEEEGL
jgi:opacity protein-like surface antigen